MELIKLTFDNPPVVWKRGGGGRRSKSRALLSKTMGKAPPFPTLLRFMTSYVIADLHRATKQTTEQQLSY